MSKFIDRPTDEGPKKDCGCGFGRGCIQNQDHWKAPGDFRHEAFKSEAEYRTAHSKALHEARLLCEDKGIDPPGEKLVGPPEGFEELVSRVREKFAERKRAIE